MKHIKYIADVFFNKSSNIETKKTIHFIIDITQMKVTKIFKDENYIAKLKEGYFKYNEVVYSCPIFKGNLIYTGQKLMRFKDFVELQLYCIELIHNDPNYIDYAKQSTDVNQKQINKKDTNMCAELTYRNSGSEFLVDFSYLAIDDKMIVNKTYNIEDDLKEGGMFDTYLWIRLEDQDNNPIITALINYQDDGNLQNTLCLLEGDELISNVMDMFEDSIASSGFYQTYIGELLNEALEEVSIFRCRPADFKITEPSEFDMHPFYDS